MMQIPSANNNKKGSMDIIAESQCISPVKLNAL
jgi:hypothetical protein